MLDSITSRRPVRNTTQHDRVILDVFNVFNVRAGGSLIGSAPLAS